MSSRASSLSWLRKLGRPMTSPFLAAGLAKGNKLETIPSTQPGRECSPGSAAKFKTRPVDI